MDGVDVNMDKVDMRTGVERRMGESWGEVRMNLR